MVSIKRLFIVSSTCIALGALLFMLHRNWLIVHIALFPSQGLNATNSATQANTVAYPRPVTISYYKNSAWLSENSTVLWQENDPAFTLKHLLKQWLQVVQDANLLNRHLAITTVAVANTSNDAFVSFDAPIFTKEMAIKTKWLLLESLLKTIRTNKLTLHSITILHHDHCMPDEHLDFRQPLSLESRL
jgi:hypothetical protein